MSTQTTEPAESTGHAVPTAVLDGAVAPYPRDKVYIKTAVLLAAITLVEVFTYAWPDLPIWSWGGDSNIGLIAALMIMMIAKFAIVAAVFMHLKYDKPILWRVFASGLLLAVGIYIAVLLMFRIFQSGEAPL